MNNNNYRQLKERFTSPYLESVTTLVSSEKWLETNSLKRLKLDLSHIMSAIGLKSTDDYIKILRKPVCSKYGNSLFKRIPYKDGSVYNLLASEDELIAIETSLKKVLQLYKSRLEWLLSGSRKTFGVIEEKNVCIIIDVVPDDKQILEYFIKLLISLLKQQLIHIEKFNFIRAASDIMKWQSHCVAVTSENVSSAVSWLMDLDLHVNYRNTAVLESLLYAINDTTLDAIYIFTDGTLCKSGSNILLEKIQDISVQPIHVSAVNCLHPTYLKFLKKFVKTTHGRFNNYIISASHKTKDFKNISMSSNVMLILKELEEAKSTLSDIQSILNDIKENSTSKSAQSQAEMIKHSQPPNEERNLTSKDWLNNTAGLSKNQLLLNHFLKKHVLNECSVLEMNDNDEEKLSNLLKCDSFSHIKFSDGSVKHVQITESMIREYKTKVRDLISKYEDRMQWLKKNSRELFGNIIEKKVVLLVDTSSSMEAKLYQVKRGLCKVIQEQLNERETFNVVHFNSKVHMWKNEMMECCSRNFEDAIVWVKSLFASGSTNTLEALQMCYGLNDIEAIYLLSDGRPDQHCEEILTQVNPKIPIHAISYNCDDEQANEFLYELSKQTSGRYHCFFENEFFVGEKFQSEDLYLIKKEIKRAHRELEKISLLHKIIQQKKTVERNIFFEPNKLKSRPASAYVDNKSSLLRTKQFNENEDKQNDVQIKKKKKKENENEIKKWIKRYGLKACKLTIIDALAPTIISRKPAYIPVLGKDVLSKVFGEALPIINTSGGINKELQVVNPQVIDLDSYEEKLNNWFKVITRKMISYILLNIPVEAKEKLEVDNVYEYSEYKDILFQSIDENDSTNKIRDNLVLLESELERGRVFLKQSTDLKEIIKQMEKETKNEVEESNSSSKIANKDVGNTGNPLRFRYHRVLARNDFDGLYYLALVKKYLNSRFVNVCFDNGEEQIISVRYVISVGGSRPCPLLKAGDYVLAKCQTQDSLNGDENCYKPAIVQVIPHEAKSSLKFYTVVTYDGFKITLLRKDMTKINRSRFVFTVRFIQEATILANNKLRTSFQESNETYLLSQESSEAFEKSDKDSDDVSSPSEHGEQDLYDIVSVHSESDMGDEVKKIDTNHDMIQENNENHIKNDRNSSLNVDATDFFDILSEQLQTNNQNELFEINLSVNGKSEADSTVIKENYNIETQQSISLELLEEYQQKIKKKQQDMEMEFDAKFHELTEQRSALHKMEEVLYEKVMHQTEQQAVFQLQLYDILKHQESLLQKQVHIQNEETQNKKDTDSDGSAVYLQLTKELLSHQEQLIKQILENQKNQLPQQTKVVQEKDEEKKETFDNTFCFSPLPSVEIKDNITEDISLKDIPWTGSSTPSDICNSSSDTVKNTDSLEKHHKIGSDEHSSELKVFFHPMSEAVLLAQGESGLFVSRVPLESDPAVKVCCVPSVLNMGEEVLARFHSDGWYYRGTVRKFLSNTTYIIEDSFGDICKIERADIISDEDDADNIIQTGSYVIGLYPNFYFSYAPGVVASIEADGAINVQFYDGQISFVPRSEVYLTTFSKFESDVAMIRQREDALVGQAVVTRDNKTGKYHLAAVRSRIAGSRNYLIEWSDQTLELQNYVFIFGSHSRHRNIKKNSHCLAIIDKDNFTYLPATVEGKKGNELSVIFCNSNTVKTVESAHAFWISEHFYKEAVTYWESKNNSTT